MRESLAKKKERLAEDFKLLQPVTPEAFEFVAAHVDLNNGSQYRIICFDEAAADTDKDKRLIYVVFAEGGQCHVVDSHYISVEVEAVAHRLDLAAEIRRVANLRNVSADARNRELDERLFIHFIDVINPKLVPSDEGLGPFVVVTGGWNGHSDPELNDEAAADLQAHLDMILWSDPDLPPCTSGCLLWDGMPPPVDVEEEWYSEDLLFEDKDNYLKAGSAEDFETFRASLERRAASEGFSIVLDSVLTDRLIAALWLLRWQFGGRIVRSPAREWEYMDGDHYRRGGYSLGSAWPQIEFPVRQPSSAERTAATVTFAAWLERLYFWSVGWKRLSDRLLVYDGDDEMFDEDEFATQRKRVLEVETGHEPLAYRGSLYVPPILSVRRV